MKHLKLGGSLLLFLGVMSMHAGVYVPKTKSEFENIISQADLAVVHFINYDLIDQALAYEKEGDEAKDETSDEAQILSEALAAEGCSVELLEDQLDEMKDAFKLASNSRRYQEAGVAFVGVDLRDIPAFIKEYELENILSLVMLFKDGEPFTSRGKLVETNACITSRLKFKQFIDEYFGDYIEDAIAKQESQRQVRVVTRPRTVVQERIVERPVYRTRYVGGYRYPYWRRRYWGGYPYWRRRRWGWGPGFGIGFGRWGRRGGFGIGFGFGRRGWW